ncbi:hypothetical protein [Lysobacter sp. HA18]
MAKKPKHSDILAAVGYVSPSTEHLLDYPDTPLGRALRKVADRARTGKPGPVAFAIGQELRTVWSEIVDKGIESPADAMPIFADAMHRFSNRLHDLLKHAATVRGKRGTPKRTRVKALRGETTIAAAIAAELELIPVEERGGSDAINTVYRALAAKNITTTKRYVRDRRAKLARRSSGTTPR